MNFLCCFCNDKAEVNNNQVQPNPTVITTEPLQIVQLVPKFSNHSLPTSTSSTKVGVAPDSELNSPARSIEVSFETESETEAESENNDIVFIRSINRSAFADIRSIPMSAV
ncbi:unnamed protein product [Rotaria sordida]|uniref:Uncharacterized protein n=1 Tax=Rotaria sordida TaxID=392033 RepID=A0A815H2T3_9BILA|nr:unnamed protein product [Rotaria sordida]CAF1346738.1 unnamed protein product [Rotaria sordida]CAF1412910.1 unnamed protein product [Rotaria sordida]CAF3884270.1 unnamed protein product [Rotaria sordida]